MNINFNLGNRINAEKHERYMPISYDVFDFDADGLVACIGCNYYELLYGVMGTFSATESDDTHYFLIEKSDPRCNEAIKCLNSGDEWTGQEYDYFAVEGTVNGKVRTFFVDVDLYIKMLN